MTDSTQPASASVALPQAKQTTPKSGVDQKSPLDILEDVLADAKNTVQGNQAQAQATQEAELEKQQQVELVKQREEKKAQEAIEIAAQLQQMQAVNQSEAGQARLAQAQTQQSELEKIKAEQKGYEIRQLGHTKV